MSRRWGPARPKRQLEWSRMVRGAAVTGAFASIPLISPLETALGRTLGDYTVTRIIANIWIRGEGPAIGEFAMGIICDDPTAPTKNPNSDLQLGDWMWVERVVTGGLMQEISSGSFQTTGPFQHLMRDLGAQRKCDLTHGPHFALVNISGTGTMLMASINVLVKLA